MAFEAGRSSNWDRCKELDLELGLR